MPALLRTTAALLLLLGSLPASAQDSYAFPFNPGSGDESIDSHLNDFNAYAATDVDGFVNELSLRYRARPELVREYIVERRWPPGDVYYGCALASYTWHSCASVLSTYERVHHHGWAVLARRLGATKESRIYQAIKDDIQAVHRKWCDAESPDPDAEANPGTPHRY